MNPAIPFWITIPFLIAIPIPVAMVVNLIRKGSPATHSKRYTSIVLGFYLVYFAYVTIATIMGKFSIDSFPPTIIQFTMVPLLILLLLIFFFSPAYKRVFANLHISDIIGVHIFRLIGVFFLLLYAQGLLPQVFAVIAGVGDIVTALTSIWVVRLWKEKHQWVKPITWAWNTFGLLDILATSGTALLITKVALEKGTPGVENLAVFPFCFIPAFAPATIIFLHLSIYRKLLKKTT